MKRAMVIVLDSAGIGEMEDAAAYGDAGSNTIGHVAAATPGFALPTLEKLGLGRVAPLSGVAPLADPTGAYGKMRELSKGKDTTVGHWEMMGVISERGFKLYPHGFPDSVIREFSARIGRGVLGNVVASGTVIIEELGREHLATGFPIVYTSADSVFQIAAHEDVVPLEELYRYCHIAREILVGEVSVARVIARPFTGEPGSFVRTPHRHDYSVEPPATYLDTLTAAGIPVIGVGKISDIFAGRGVRDSYPTVNNRDGIQRLRDLLAATREDAFIFVNLVDFDSQYGHRNDPAGYARALMEFDAALPGVMELMTADDLLIITADHGCDPTTPSTDHSREFVPLIAWSPGMRTGVSLGVRETFSDLGRTVADFLGVEAVLPGTGFSAEIAAAQN
jgi:phosphopentomutase